MNPNINESKEEEIVKSKVSLALSFIVVLLVAFQVTALANEVTVLWGDVLTRGIWTEYAAKFEEETGIKVNAINVAYDQRFDKVVTSAMSGVGTFDVIQLDAIWTPQFAAPDGSGI